MVTLSGFVKPVCINFINDKRVKNYCLKFCIMCFRGSYIGRRKDDRRRENAHNRRYCTFKR